MEEGLHLGKGVCIWGRGVCIWEGVCVQGGGGLHLGKGVCIQGDLHLGEGGLHPRGWDNYPYPRDTWDTVNKQAVPSAGFNGSLVVHDLKSLRTS